MARMASESPAIRATARASQHALPQQWRRNLHRRLGPDGHRGTPRARHGSGGADYDGDGYPDIFVANDNAPTSSSTTFMGSDSRRSPWRLEWPLGKEGMSFRAWAWISGMCGTTAALPLDDCDRKAGVSAVLNLGHGQFEERTAVARLRWIRSRCPVGRTVSPISTTMVGRTCCGALEHRQQRASVLAADVRGTEFRVRNLGNGKFKNVSATAGPDFQIRARTGGWPSAIWTMTAGLTRWSRC